MSTSENFSLDYINSPSLSPQAAKDYLLKYFKPIKDGSQALLEDGKFTIIDTRVAKSTYFSRIANKEVVNFYFKEYTKIFSITFELDKPQVFDSKVNLCAGLKFKETKKYTDYSKKDKEGVEIMLKYIKEVLADNSKESYEYLLNWFSSMLKGSKNDACLYLKGPQGIGKSTITEFLQFYVVGDLYLETGSQALKSHFNSILGGKLLVVFEELENFSVSEWYGISAVLKRNLTQKTYILESKGVNPYLAKNMNNYIINSNNNAIKDDEGRRYYILDVSQKMRENHDYFGNIRDKCFNDKVGEAFYAYMLERNTEGFIPQSYPMTQNKLDSFSKNMSPEAKFLRDEFILPEKSMKVITSNLYKHYTNYCSSNGLKPTNKIDFKSFLLKTVGVEVKKISNDFYVCSIEKLKEAASKYHWVHEVDLMDYNNMKNRLKNDEIEVEESEVEIENRNLKYEIEILKKELEEEKKKNQEQVFYISNPVKEEVNCKEELSEKPKKKMIKIKKLVLKKKPVIKNDDITPDGEDLLETL